MKYVVGIDEVGRGPLAGPVTVCVVVCGNQMYTKLKRDRRLPPLGKDSKKLSPKSRKIYTKYLNHIGISYVVVHISNKIIDAKGISFALRVAIEKGLKKLQQKLKLNPVRGREGSQRASASNGIKPTNCRILLDGSLKAPKEFKKQKTIIKGDEKEKIIAWASILAKVSRDELMSRASKKFPRYGFEMHKGYGTLRHRLAIRKYGLTVFHRKTFCNRLISI